jgi:hypothetical protein
MQRFETLWDFVWNPMVNSNVLEKPNLSFCFLFNLIFLSTFSTTCHEHENYKDEWKKDKSKFRSKTK